MREHDVRFHKGVPSDGKTTVTDTGNGVHDLRRMS